MVIDCLYNFIMKPYFHSGIEVDLVWKDLHALY